jgi:hypothetical protein
MAIELFNHESCIDSAKIKSAYCAEMSSALTVDFKQYMIPSSIMLTSDILSVYLAVQDALGNFTTIKVNNTDITFQPGNKITINNQDVSNLKLHNRIIVIPNNAANLCFTGVVGSNVSNKRPMWLKRSDTTKMYDYIAITSIDYFANYYTILEYPNITFINGVGTGFTNLTSLHNKMKVDFDGQYVGAINAINGVSSLTLDTTFTSTGPSRAFLYSQGTIEYALDVNGAPDTWVRHLTVPPIDNDIPFKFWMRDFKAVTSELTVYANNAIRVLGTEFLL